MEKKNWIYIFLIIIFFVTAFVWGYHLDKRNFKEKIEGILISKSKGSKGSYNIHLYNSKTKSNTKRNYTKFSTFEMLVIGDSIVKDHNSYFLKVYSKKNNIYYFKDSFEIGHW